jgi:dTDP-4-dehydrorhamnose reductase
MRVLITGGSGTLGSSLAYELAGRYDVVATYNVNPIKIEKCKTLRLDITNRENVLKKVKKLAPEVIVHTAALVGVAACQKNPDLAWKLNVEGTRNLKDASKEIDARIIYISTDYVFDGNKGNYSETDEANPLTVYGKTKLEGEKILGEEDTIFRTCIYGWNIISNRPNFATWLIGELENKKNVTIFTNQYNSPMLTNNCAEAIKYAIENEICGLYNIAGSEKASKYDFAITLADIFGFDKGFILPTKLEDPSRPKDTSLDITKAKREFPIHFLNLREGIIKMKKLKEGGYLKYFQRASK